MVEDPSKISDAVLGTRDEFFQRLSKKADAGDNTEQKLMQVSVGKYKQLEDLPQVLWRLSIVCICICVLTKHLLAA